jgi:hypothetical protein
MMKRSTLLLAASVVLLASCGDNTKQAKAAATETTTEAPAADKPADNSDKAVRSEIKVTIGSGEMAGTYEALCREACTSYGIAGEKVLGNQYSEDGKGPKELSSVQLIVDDVTGDKTTQEFTVTVGFGELFGKTTKTYNINTRKGKKDGSGTLDLQYSGDKATVKIKGTSKEGVPLDLVIESSKVTTPENLLSEIN